MTAPLAAARPGSPPLAPASSRASTAFGSPPASLPLLRRRRALERALGPAIAAAMEAPDVVETLVNSDGSVWIDRLGGGLERLDAHLTAFERETAIRLLAAEAGEIVGASHPMLSTILPESAARVQALLPPLVDAPVLAIRKRALKRHRLADYVADGIATPDQARRLAHAVAARRTIVVAGGTGSGKTTLLNALLEEPGFLDARVLILEDTAELQCASPNQVQLLTKRTAPQVTMGDLVRMSLRLRPDRIVIGEVRDGAALDVLKAWNTGHPGGLLTLHANSAADALLRLEDLCAEAAPVSRRTIAAAVDLVVFIARVEPALRASQPCAGRGDGQGIGPGVGARVDRRVGPCIDRRIEAILEVKSVNGGVYVLE